jgi:hypothetical protein
MPKVMLQLQQTAKKRLLHAQPSSRLVSSVRSSRELWAARVARSCARLVVAAAVVVALAAHPRCSLVTWMTMFCPSASPRRGLCA